MFGVELGVLSATLSDTCVVRSGVEVKCWYERARRQCRNKLHPGLYPLFPGWRVRSDSTSGVESGTVLQFYF